MLEQDTDMRRQLTAERAERLAGDYGRASPKRKARRSADRDGRWPGARAVLARLRRRPTRKHVPALDG